MSELINLPRVFETLKYELNTHNIKFEHHIQYPLQEWTLRIYDNIDDKLLNFICKQYNLIGRFFSMAFPKPFFEILIKKMCAACLEKFFVLHKKVWTCSLICELKHSQEMDNYF